MTENLPRVTLPYESRAGWAICPYCGIVGHVMLDFDGELRTAHLTEGLIWRKCGRLSGTVDVRPDLRPATAETEKERSEVLSPQAQSEIADIVRIRFYGDPEPKEEPVLRVGMTVDTPAGRMCVVSVSPTWADLKFVHEERKSDVVVQEALRQIAISVGIACVRGGLTEEATKMFRLADQLADKPSIFWKSPQIIKGKR